MRLTLKIFYMAAHIYVYPDIGIHRDWDWEEKKQAYNNNKKFTS